MPPLDPQAELLDLNTFESMVSTTTVDIRLFVLAMAEVALITLTTSASVHASLGGIETTIEADRLAIDATQRTQRTPRFTLHELQAPSGTTIREYVSPAGTVFGVAWQGPFMPDLRQLLGAHFDEYVAAMETSRIRRSPVLVQLPGFVLQSSGHMRAFAGSAYLPQALPPDVAAEEIR